ncbi:MAG: hypothetical protein J5I52_11725 [Saprospiraceae bacterium]|jgi:hypothetical protein|nr:hypothetical protein [Saprospiraceae bacterium]
MNPTLKQAHLQTAQCHHADQSLQKSLLCPPKKKNKKISPASQKLNLPTRKPTDENKLTKKLKPFTDIELTRPKKEPLAVTAPTRKQGFSASLDRKVLNLKFSSS